MWQLLFTSTLLFVTASVLETTLHELGHFVAAWSLGGSPTLFHTSVRYSISDPSSKIFVALAGPLVSLLIGVFTHIFLQRSSMSGATRLFTFYLAAFGYIGILGYTMVAPFFAYGDTGFVLRALDMPMWGIVVTAITAAAALFVILQHLARHVVACMSAETANDSANRMSFVRSTITLPLVLGTMIVTALNLPAPTMLSLIAPICSPLSLLWVFGSYVNGHRGESTQQNAELVSRFQWKWMVPTLGAVLMNRWLVSGFTLTSLLVCMVVHGHAALARPHPLAPVTRQELKTTSELVRHDSRWRPTMRFVSVQLDEPSKSRVMRGDTSLHRSLFCVVFDRESNATYEVFVDVTSRELTEWRRVNKVEPSLTIEDYVQTDSIVRADKRWQAALKRRGLTPEDVYVDGWASGISIASFGTRLMRTVTYQKNGPIPTFDRPLEGVEALVDLSRNVVMEFSDRPKAPIPAASTTPGQLERFAAHHVISSMQPSDARITVRNGEVSWHQWRFRIAMHPREGLTLSTVRVVDGDRERPIAYRMNLAEMVVPYGDTTQGWFWRAAFDVGEYGLGQLSSSLKPGVDAPRNARFISAPFVSSTGAVTERKNMIALYERDAGILWRHDNGKSVTGRRDRELVVLHVATVGNYDYSIGYVFTLDGTLKTEVQLTGILLPKAVQDSIYDASSTGQMYGPLVQSHVITPTHQHFFNFRIDMDVDDTANVVNEMDLRAPSGSENRFKNGILMDAFDLRFEQEAQRNMSLANARTWIVRNAHATNALGGPTGYMLMPGANALPYIQPGTWVRNRAGFIDHHFWATRYHDGELYPAGAYPNQSTDGQGLPAYCKNNESINGKDVVLWYTMGVSHFPRPEEWPIMSSHRAGFALVPNGFHATNPTATPASSSK